jgi:hypothetical protein
MVSTGINFLKQFTGFDFMLPEHFRELYVKSVNCTKTTQYNIRAIESVEAKSQLKV